MAMSVVLSENEIGVDGAGNRLHNLASLLQRAADTQKAVVTEQFEPSA
jgi:hypothetical protein